MAFYPNWEVIPGSPNNLRLWLKNINGDKVQYYDLAPNNANAYGYSFKIPSDIGALQGLYEGSAYMYVQKKSFSSTSGIRLHYAYDSSSLFHTSYSISIGPAYINLAGTTSPIFEMAGNYPF